MKYMPKRAGRRLPYHIVLAFIIPCFLLCLACGNERIAILSYNVENLFDGVDDGSEYYQYDPGRGSWTDALFRRKLDQIVSAIRRTAPGGPDIVLLQEIENQNVLLELNAALGYEYAAVNRRPPAATTVGLLSRFPLSRVAAYELPRYKNNPVREILEATVEVNGEKMVVFNNHWKSKTGSAAQTEKARLQAAALLLERVRAARTREPGATVIMAGDLNECHDEYTLVRGAYRTALLLSTDRAPESWHAGSLVLTGVLNECGVFDDRVVVYDPWINHQGTPAGSYYYKGSWETIDHILLLPGQSAYRLTDFYAYSDPDMLTPRSKAPLSWNKKKPDKGYSDHLPLVMVLTPLSP